MHPDFQRLLQEATRLTRDGDLGAATAAIQQALRRQHGASAPDGDVIDVEAREVHPDGVALPGTGAEPAPHRATEPPLAEAPATAPKPDAATGQPTPEQFIAGRFGGAGVAGRDYQLYLPPGHGPAPRGLVVMLHGCTQDADDFARGTQMNAIAGQQGLAVLYPIQPQRANPHKCWNWFKPTHQQRDRGEAGLLAGLVRDVVARHGIDPARVYVAGLSAGGAMAAILAQAHPELFAAVGVHSGLPAGAARDLPSALESMKQGPARPTARSSVPTIVFHGSADATVHPANGDKVFESFLGSGTVQTDVVQPPGSRRSTRRVLRDPAGASVAEHWSVEGSPHAWSGGSPGGSYTDPRGPDASREMVRFFLQHQRAGGR